MMRPINVNAASYFCRQELDQRTIPDCIPLERPKPTRTGLPVPIRADFEFFIHRCITRFVNPCHEGCAEITESNCHDSDWMRVLRPVEPVPGVLSRVGFYPPGLLGGDWLGSYIVSFSIFAWAHVLD